MSVKGQNHYTFMKQNSTGTWLSLFVGSEKNMHNYGKRVYLQISKKVKALKSLKSCFKIDFFTPKSLYEWCEMKVCMLGDKLVWGLLILPGEESGIHQ